MSGFKVMIITKTDTYEIYNNSTVPPTHLGTVRVVFPSLSDPKPRYQGRGVGQWADVDTGPRRSGEDARRALVDLARSR